MGLNFFFSFCSLLDIFFKEINFFYLLSFIFIQMWSLFYTIAGTR